MAATAAIVEQPVAAPELDASEIAAAQAFDHAHATLRRSASVDGGLSASSQHDSAAVLEGYTVWRPHRRRAARRWSRGDAATDGSAEVVERGVGRVSGEEAPLTSFDWASDSSPRFHDSGPLLSEPFASDPAWWDIDARSRSPRRHGPVCPLDTLLGGRSGSGEAAVAGDLEAEGVPADGPDIADFAGGMEGDIMTAAATAAATVDGADTAEVGYLEQLRQRVLALSTVRPPRPSLSALVSAPSHAHQPAGGLPCAAGLPPCAHACMSPRLLGRGGAGPGGRCLMHAQACCETWCKHIRVETWKGG